MVAVHSLALLNNILLTYGLYYISYDDIIVLCTAAIAAIVVVVVVVVVALDPNATAAAATNSSPASTTMHCRRLVSHLHLHGDFRSNSTCLAAIRLQWRR